LLSVAAALTLLPALLGVLGPRINALTIRRVPTRGGLWAALAQGVMRRPGLVFLAVLTLLIGLGAPFLRVELGAPDASILPPDVQSRHGFDLLQAHWGAGELAPVLLVFQTTDGSSPLRPDHVQALASFMRRVGADPRVQRVES